MFGSKTGAGSKPGQARFANAVFTYTPDFASGDYKEGVISESDAQVTFEFQSPYIIGATPPNTKEWGIYDAGCKNGLIARGKAVCTVSLSTDDGKTWIEGGKLGDSPDLTDLAKGHRQYWLRLNTGAKQLVGCGLSITTVCQANGTILPRLKDGSNTIRFDASGQAITSAGLTLPAATAHVVEGKIDSPKVTLELRTPHGEIATGVYAAAHVRSSNPPDPAVKYQIDVSLDGGKTWKPLVKDWTVNRLGDDPGDFWSQSFCWGNASLAEKGSSFRVRFGNNGGKQYARSEAHLVYRTPKGDATEVRFAWSDDSGDRQASHIFPGEAANPAWVLPAGKNVQTKWVQMKAARVGE
jgi:hypothetical protein